MGKSRLSHALHELLNMRAGRANHETIRKRVVAGSRMDAVHLSLLMIAMLIASIGLNVDSTEAVVGAMLICPLMGSVIASAYAIASADSRLLREAMLSLLLQVTLCLITSTLYFVVSPISRETSELLTNSSPTIWDALIALAGGFAGGIGISRSQEPGIMLSGVAVATALMPPLCAAGYGVAVSDLSYFAGALYEFLINAAFISMAAEAVFVLVRTPLKLDLNGDGVVTAHEDQEAHRLSRRLRRRMVAGTLVFVIPCFVMTAHAVQATIAENNGEVFAMRDRHEVEQTTRELEAICPELTSYHVGEIESFDTGRDSLSKRVVATVQTSEALSSQRQASLEALIRVHLKQLDEVKFELAPEGAQGREETTS